MTSYYVTAVIQLHTISDSSQKNQIMKTQEWFVKKLTYLVIYLQTPY